MRPEASSAAPPRAFARKLAIHIGQFAGDKGTLLLSPSSFEGGGFPWFLLQLRSELAGFPSLRSRRLQTGRFPELPSLRAAISRLCGRFPELLSPRARVFGFSWQVVRVSVAVCPHAGSASRKTCRRSPVPVHGDSETRETRQEAGSVLIISVTTPFGRCGLKSAPPKRSIASGRRLFGPPPSSPHEKRPPATKLSRSA